MTLHATREGQKITIHHQPSDTHVTEDAAHVRYFHEQLGRLLNDAEAERGGGTEAQHAGPF
jgi:hypothetical protein